MPFLQNTNSKLRHTVLSACAAAALGAGVPGASAAPAVSLARSIDVDASPAVVWTQIGAFCAIKNWHPMIATCTEDGKVPSTRTLVGKDGKTTFVETQVERSDAQWLYSYNFVSSPIPAANYRATIRVVPHGNGGSTVIWSGSYIPASGKEKEVEGALAGIYESGLNAIRAKFAK